MLEEKMLKVDINFPFLIASEIIQTFDDKETGILEAILDLDNISIEGFMIKFLTENIKNISKPMKITILHKFIEFYLNAYFSTKEYEISKDFLDYDYEEIKDFFDNLESLLNVYGMRTTDYPESIKRSYEKYESADCENWREYIDELSVIYEEFMNKLFSKSGLIINAVFYLLYNNKNFLYKFNMFISKYIKILEFDTNIFDNKHNIKRVSFIPSWLKKGIIYRDRGKCQHCGKDLSGIISISNDSEVHFDHIIPLEKGGINDPINFQLLCAKCNLLKNKRIILPEYKYQMFW